MVTRRRNICPGVFTESRRSPWANRQCPETGGFAQTCPPKTGTEADGATFPDTVREPVA